MIEYDLIVIGAGAGGIGAAGVANRFGLKVVMIDKKGFNVGGDCLNYGCVPSKALIHIARQFHGGKVAERFGLKTKGKADYQKVMDYVHAQQDVIRAHENPDHFRERDMDVEIGAAKFIDEKTIKVNGKLMTAPKIVLATGSIPRELNVPGMQLVDKIYDNESLFWELKKLPDNFLIIGGGPIACEMAQAFQRLGSQVIIVNRGEQLAGKELPEFSTILQRQMEEEGVKIYHTAEVVRFTNSTTAMVKQGKQNFEIEFETVMAAIGRVVRTEGLDLQKGGVKVEQGKMLIDDYYRTTNPRVYAVGDAMGREQFSHGAEMHNRDLVRNFVVPFFKKRHTLKHFSWVTFTDPEIATFGYSEQDLKEKNINFERIEQSFEEDDRAIVSSYRYAKLVLYFSKPHWMTRKVRLLGGTMIAPHAGELIQELILANQEALSINTIFNKIYPYPVATRINQKAIMNKRQGDLTPSIQRVLAWLYRVNG